MKTPGNQKVAGPVKAPSGDEVAVGVPPRDRRKWTVQVAILLSALFLLPTLSLDIVRPLVLFDEQAHIDYVFHLADGEVPVWGTTLSDRTMALSECVADASPVENCVREQLETGVSSSEFSYQAQQPILGYGLMALTSRFFLNQDAFHFDQLLILRLANLASFTIFAMAWAYTLSFLTRSRVVATAVSALLIANPWFYGSFTYVTNDSAAIIVGSVLVAFYIRFLFRIDLLTSRRDWLVVALTFSFLGVASASTKFTSIAPVLAIVTALLITHVFVRRIPGLLRRLFAPLFLIVSFIATYVLTNWWRNSNSPLDERSVISELLGPSYRSIPEVAVTRLRDLPSLVLGWDAVNIGYVTPAVILIGVASCGLILGALASSRNHFPLWVSMTPQTLIFATLALSTAMLIGIPLAFFVQGPFEPSFIGRYLIPLLPLYGLATVPLLCSKQRLSQGALAVGFVTLILLAAPPADLFRNLLL